MKQKVKKLNELSKNLIIELLTRANYSSSFLISQCVDIFLKEKMKMVIENPEEGKEQVKRGKKYIRENLAWVAVVKRVEEVYLGLIEKGNL